MAAKSRTETSRLSVKMGWPTQPERGRLRSWLVLTLFGLAAMFIVAVAGAGWLGIKASEIRAQLTSAVHLVPSIKENLSADRPTAAVSTVDELRTHTAAAVQAANDPLWTLASSLPGLGANFRAITEVTRSVDDVADLGLGPLVDVYASLNWETLLPSSSGAELEQLSAASPRISAAADAIRLSAKRLDAIDTTSLLSPVAGPLTSATDQLHGLTAALEAAADASKIAPGMLGEEGPRNFLLIIQNNAESRASGGIPGALAVLTVDHGKLALSAQSSASDLGIMSPALPVDQQQEQIYSTRLGKYMQDVNLTPDFPTAAATARKMWSTKTGQRVDGVISIDPVVLSYILQATGPVNVDGPELPSLKATGLPTELTGDNVVSTLLSDVYTKIRQPKLQDAYYANVAKEVFSALSSGKGEAKGLITGITRGTEERRVLLWSSDSFEQSVISKYPLSGSVTGPSVSPAQFGAYFNDGTGAKMDYYVKRTVQLIKGCPSDGYEQTTVRVTSKNTAPASAATSLPEYVNGGGVFGIAPGYVQTNIVAYGPVQANVESATVDGQKTPFAPYLHDSRPVGVVAQTLAPGESKTVEFTFGKIVQHTEPNLVVTPSVQHVKDVVLSTQTAACD